MHTTIFLAKLMGPMLIAMGVATVIHPERFWHMAQEFLESDALLFISGVITLPVGLAIVNTHNVWEMNWPVIITIFGWLMILAGIVRMVLPQALKTAGRAMIEKVTYLAVPGSVMTAFGAYLTYQGYAA